jgi:hypothetical protein
MSRPVNYERRYEMALRRLNRLTIRYEKLQKEYAALKAKKEPAPLTPAWRRFVTRYLG